MASDKALGLAFAMMQAAELRHRVESEEGEEQALAIYGEVLRNVQDDVLREAVVKHVAGSKWWATPAELLDLSRAVAIERQRGAERLPDSSGCLPKAEVVAALRAIAAKLNGGSLSLDGRGARRDSDAVAGRQGPGPDPGASPPDVGARGEGPAPAVPGSGIRPARQLPHGGGARSARPRRDVDG